MVEHQPSKLNTWVRFPSPAFLLQKIANSFFMHKKRPASTYLQEIRADQEVEGWCDMHFMYVFWPAPEFTFIIG